MKCYEVYLKDDLKLTCYGFHQLQMFKEYASSKNLIIIKIVSFEVEE